MPSRRQRRINALLRQALGQLLQSEVADPRLDFVTVTGVETSPDLRQAHIYVTFLTNPQDQQESLEALRKAAGYLRRQLGQKVYLRYLPELTFHLDSSSETGFRIDGILDELENSRENMEE